MSIFIDVKIYRPKASRDPPCDVSVGSLSNFRAGKVRSVRLEPGRFMKPNLPAVTRAFHDMGRDFHTRGWVLGTSGNFSTVVSRKPLKLFITASSVSKGHIRPADVLMIGADGAAVGRSSARPSAETALHVVVAQSRGAGAVLHTHSVWGTLLSEFYGADRGLHLSGFEMLKGLEGIRTHEHTEWLPILENDQDIAALAGRVKTVLEEWPAIHGFLLRGHGLYTWGDDLAQARRHVEILEFLLETIGRMHGSRKNP
jgi:methylthioribulose-1-phosphate dehydratase